MRHGVTAERRRPGGIWHDGTLPTQRRVPVELVAHSLAQVPHQFLSDEWFDALDEIRRDLADGSPDVDHQVSVNLVITEVPTGHGDVDAHVSVARGQLEIDRGHVAHADLRITLDYDTARSLLVERDPQAGMQAFMSGRIRVSGDMAKLAELQASPLGERARRVADRVRAVTD